jgi:hypothetical protein
VLAREQQITGGIDRFGHRIHARIQPAEPNRTGRRNRFDWRGLGGLFVLRQWAQ